MLPIQGGTGISKIVAKFFISIGNAISSAVKSALKALGIAFQKKVR